MPRDRDPLDDGIDLAKRTVRLWLGWIAGSILLLLAFVSLLHARVAAIVFLIMAAHVLPPVRGWIAGLGRWGKLALILVGGAFLVWLLTLGH